MAWRKYVHFALVNRLGGLGLPSNSVIMKTALIMSDTQECSDTIKAIFRGRKATACHNKNNLKEI